MENSLQKYIQESNYLIGEECTSWHLNDISDILYSKQFYLENCKLPLTPKKYKDCPLTTAAQSFNKKKYWACFHSDWRTSFGKFVIHKGTDIIEITRDTQKVRIYLDLPLK